MLLGRHRLPELVLSTNGVERTLLSAEGGYGWPNWAPLYRSIAASHFMVDYSLSNDDLAAEIITLRPDGSGVRELRRPNKQRGFFDEHPAWAPAGGQIVYDEYYADMLGDQLHSPRGIWIMNGDGSNRHRVSTDGSDPDWQPLH